MYQGARPWVAETSPEGEWKPLAGKDGEHTAEGPSWTLLVRDCGLEGVQLASCFELYSFPSLSPHLPKLDDGELARFSPVFGRQESDVLCAPTSG